MLNSTNAYRSRARGPYMWIRRTTEPLVRIFQVSSIRWLMLLLSLFVGVVWIALEHIHIEFHVSCSPQGNASGAATTQKDPLAYLARVNHFVLRFRQQYEHDPLVTMIGDVVLQDLAQLASGIDTMATRLARFPCLQSVTVESEIELQKSLKVIAGADTIIGNTIIVHRRTCSSARDRTKNTMDAPRRGNHDHDPHPMSPFWYSLKYRDEWADWTRWTLLTPQPRYTLGRWRCPGT